MTQKIENSNDERRDYFNRAFIFISILIPIFEVVVYYPSVVKLRNKYLFLSYLEQHL
jgi:hypothetical protein